MRKAHANSDQKLQAVSPDAAVAAAPTVKIILVVYLATLLGYFSPIGRYFESLAGRRVDFVARHALGQGPYLHPKLKVFWYDDLTVADRHSTDLTAGDWATAIAAVQRTKPRLIVIDKTFAFVSASAPDLAALNASLRGGAPIVTLADGRDEVLPGRPMLPLTRGETRPGVVDRDASGDEAYAAEKIRDLGWIRQDRRYSYGPDPAVEASIAKVGHAMVNEDGTMPPVIRLAASRILPHAGFYAGNGIELANDGVRVGGTLVPLTRFGDVIPNLLGPWEYEPLRKSMRGLLRAARDGVPLQGIEAGDTVVLLPAMFTGNVDLKRTPLGNLPGGLLVTAILNSSMTSQWLTPLPFGPLLILMCCVLGACVVRLLATVWSVSAIGALLALNIGGGVALFAYADIVVPWDFSCLGLLGAGVGTLVVKMRAGERRNFWLDVVLRGVVPPGRLAEIIRDPTSLRLEPSEQVVTIVFIDIVGFSTTADGQSPKEAFLELKKIIKAATAIVHHHGGVVDRTLGDGLLCYFGCDYSGRTTRRNHADQAVACAIEIQRANIHWAISRSTANAAVYPLRIGINTAGVYLGDLGDSLRIDFTLIGDGVNFAQRLESSCEPNLMLIGTTTKNLLSADVASTNRILKKFVKIKHHADLAEAYEVHPFGSELIDQATKAYWNYKKVERRDNRRLVQSTCAVLAHSQFGRVELVDSSDNGMGIVLPVYLARGVELTLALSSQSAAFQARLKQDHLAQITVEVRWGRIAGDGFFHGVLVKGLLPVQMQVLTTLLHEVAAAPQDKAG